MIPYPCWVYKGKESKLICQHEDDEDNKKELEEYTKDGWKDTPAKKKNA